jgi:small-conductance mechanosensitive channel
MEAAMKQCWVLTSIVLSVVLLIRQTDEASADDLPASEAVAAEQPAPQLAQTAPVEAQLAQTSPAAPPAAAAPEPAIPDVEKVARLQRGLDADHVRLCELQSALNAPRAAYAKAKAEFEQLDMELVEAKKPGPAGENEADAAARLAALGGLEMKWKLAKERFELELQERQVLQEQIATLQQKLKSDKAVLDQLTGAAPPKNADASPAPVTPAPATTTEPTAPAVPPAAAPVVTGTANAPLLPAMAAVANASGAAQAAAAVNPAETVKPPRAEVVKAVEAVRQTEEDAQLAEDQARTVAERVELLRESIRQARLMRETARKKVDLSDATVHKLEAEIQTRLAAGESPRVIQELHKNVEATLRRWRAEREESRQRANRLDELQTELDELLSDHLAATEKAEAKRREAEAAKALLETVQNPFSPRNMLNWLVERGPRVLGLLLAMILCLWLARAGESRLVNLMTRRGGRGGVEERENRARTLVGVFRNVATLLIMICGTLTLLDEIGLPVGPLMGGAAVAGLAIAFGAQNLIKDFFTGFMILLEQQYMVNDVVRIGDISGQVERISLRMTTLRDLEGRVHFLPHGNITAVTNMTHGWSRAVFDIGVAYKEDVDNVIQVLLELGQQLRRDPEYGLLILDDPTMLGVDAFGESGVTIKFYLKTRPLRQWPVKREMLRRIKNRFDELGIEIPFPHRTLYHHHSANDAVRARDHGGWSDEHEDDRSAA